MTATITKAADDILTMFKSAWETSGAASEISAGVYVPVYWPNVDVDGMTDTTEEWVRILFQNSGSGKHAGIGDGIGLYTKRGAVWFQVFTVKGKGPDRANALAQQIVDSFEGKTSPNGVVFYDTTINQSVDEGWSMTRITIDYEFDEFK